MKWNISAASSEKGTAEMLVFLTDFSKPLFQESAESVATIIGVYKQKISDKRIQGEWFEPACEPLGCALYINSARAVKGLAERETLKTLIFQAMEFAARKGLSHIAFAMDGEGGAAFALDALEALLIGDYRFDRYLTAEKKAKKVKGAILVSEEELTGLKKSAKERAVIAESVNIARDLVNEPPDVVTPEYLADSARSMAKKNGLKCHVLDEKKLKSEGYNGLLTVGAGSQYPPRLISLEYTPSSKKASSVHLCLVGKGVTFDSGGISLKPSSDMWKMKGDMAGAAAVLATMEAVAALKPSIKVSAVIATACNGVDAMATFPGQIFKARNGKTIHVDNTDAEGRLILTDGFSRAAELKPTHVVDIATLTGSIVMALGASMSGLFSNDDALRDTLMQAAEETGDALWPMPICEEYRKHIDCDFADVNNIHNTGGRSGGSIIAALFLREFIPENVAWAHLDIAGPYMTPCGSSPWKYYRPGATGVGVRLFCELINLLGSK